MMYLSGPDCSCIIRIAITTGSESRNMLVCLYSVYQQESAECITDTDILGEGKNGLGQPISRAIRLLFSD